MRTGVSSFTLVLAAVSVGCSTSATVGGGSSSGNGQPGGSGTITLGGASGTQGGGTGTTGSGTSATGQLTIAIRDFKFYSASDSSTVADFENVPTAAAPWDDKEIVATVLGSDHKPVYKNASATTLTTHGKAGFDMWYRDTAGTNIRKDVPLTLTQQSDGSWQYDSEKSGVPLAAGQTKMFFPIDDGSQYATTFGNQGKTHNYSFTGEIHTIFTYAGGEVFHFRGDDDVFVFIDNKLVINLGGIHSAEPADIQIDTLGLTKGNQYPLDFFYAERHVTESNLLITTTLNLATNPNIPIY